MSPQSPRSSTHVFAIRLRCPIQTAMFVEVPGLSASTIVRLKEVWQGEMEHWQRRDLSARRYVYFWADGDDYQRLYIDPLVKPPLPFNRTADEKNIQEPLQLLEYFYKEVDREKDRFDDREVGYARYLLGQHSFADIEDLIDYAAGRLKKSKNLTVLSFGILKSFLDPWIETRAKRLRAREMRTAIAGCYLCDDHGYLILRGQDDSHRVISYECPHDASEVELLEERKGMLLDRPLSWQ